MQEITTIFMAATVEEHIIGMFFAAFAALVAVGLYVMIKGNSQNNKIGRVKCKRCGHTGVPKTKVVPFHGPTSVCSNCSSEDWVSINQ